MVVDGYLFEDKCDEGHLSRTSQHTKQAKNVLNSALCLLLTSKSLVPSILNFALCWARKKVNWSNRLLVIM